MFDDLKKLIKEKDIQFVDLRFTDLIGTWHHMTYHIGLFDTVLEGICFDGSSIAGWQPINDSDMMLLPVPDRAFVDPFVAQPTLVLFCDVRFPDKRPYDRDPRYVAKKAQEYLKNTGIADEAYYGPEAEFFIFDDVRFSSSAYESFFALDSSELPIRSGTKCEGGNMGHRPKIKGGYFPVGPVDSGQDIRSEMLSMLIETGISVEKHHHEVGSAQHEIGISYATPVSMGDDMQTYKYVIHNVAHSFGKTATFMPKPVYGDNGTGMHVHQSLWKGGKNIFAGDKYAGLSQDCLYYIGGVLKHAHAINAFTNPTTNSYKRLVPGYEAPVILAYSSRNRSASCRIPHADSDGARRVEMRFPDPAANCYLAFSAMLMAGLDGIKNKIHPGEPMEEDLYTLPDGGKSLPSMATSLQHACDALDRNRSFLHEGDVFSDALIDSYIALRKKDIARIQQFPHPLEFDLYYSV